MAERGVLAVGQNSVWQFTYQLPGLQLAKVNRVARVERFASGKGLNVARALRAVGVTAEVMGYCGGPSGRRFSEGVAAERIAARLISIAGETRTCVTVIEDDGRTTELVEPSPPVSEAERERFHAEFPRALQGASLLVISGTAMAGETPGCYLQFVQLAREAGVPTVLDSYREHALRALEAGPEILKINEHELAELAGEPLPTAEQRARVCRGLCDRHGIRWVVVTRGADGSEGFDGNAYWKCAAPQVEVVNPIGSGDAATAGLVVELVSGERPPAGLIVPGGPVFGAALRRANAMGGANCLHLRTGHVVPAEVEGLLATLKVVPA